jgi:hypothetical protein
MRLGIRDVGRVGGDSLVLLSISAHRGTGRGRVTARNSSR